MMSTRTDRRNGRQIVSELRSVADRLEVLVEGSYLDGGRLLPAIAICRSEVERLYDCGRQTPRALRDLADAISRELDAGG